jgi:hypothetical protein
VKILEAAAGNLDAALANLDTYIDEHRLRLAEIRATATVLMNRMTPAERERFAKRSMDLARPVRERLETLARTFSDPPRVLMKLQPLL